MTAPPRLVFPSELGQLPSFYTNHVTMQSNPNEEVTLTLFQVQPMPEDKNEAVAVARIFLTAGLARRIVEIMAPALGLKVATKEP